MKITFYKYEGTGNDFVIIDNRIPACAPKPPKGGLKGTSGVRMDSELIKKLCDKHFGIGADGLMLIENAKGFDFKMVYFNADGNESTMCGNGGRCIAHLAKKLKLFKGNTAKFIAIDGIHEAILGKETVKLKMCDVDKINEHKFYSTLNTGSPHYVTIVKNVITLPVKIDGRTIRNRPPFKKEGINVNFVQVKPNLIPLLRTYERGVEDETLSCGTGTVATALVLAKKGLSTGKNFCDIQTMGGLLKVWFTPLKEGGFKDIWLEGPVNEVFKGEIEV